MSLTKKELEILLKDNKYVKKITNDSGIMYTEEFYREICNKINAGMDRLDAYASLGFDVEKLGENRAYAACRRAMEKSKNRFKQMKFVNGTIPYSEMGKMTPEEELDYLRSRVCFLEMAQNIKKNYPDVFEELFTSSKNQE